MHRLTIAQRLYLTLVPLALLGVAIPLITARSLRDNASPLIKAQHLKELALTSLSLLLVQDDATKTMLLDPDNPASNMRKIKAYDENQKVIERITALHASPAVRDLTICMSELDAKVLRDIDTQVLEAMGDGKADKARQLYFGTYEGQRAKYEAYIRKLIELADTEAKAAAAQLQASNAVSLRHIVGALVSGLALVALCLAYLARSIARRMDGVVSRLTQEHAEAQGSTHLMSETSRRLSEGVASTSAALQRIEASVSSFAARVRANDQHAASARASSAQAVQSADHATGAIERLVAATKEVQRSSGQVLSIIQVMNEISFKTNLLALNASIEAARAGEAGLGFAVVADEVRNLAKSSAEAAQQTAELVQASVEKTKQGYEISERAARALANTVSEAHRIHGVIDEMASNSRRQNENIQQITDSLVHIGSIGQKSTAEAERTHRVAETLRSRSQAVEEIVDELVALVGARA